MTEHAPRPPAGRSTPPDDALDRGHVFRWDPPPSIGAVDRWTCERCGLHAYRWHVHGEVDEYGDALGRRCPGRPVDRLPTGGGAGGRRGPRKGL